MGDSVGALEGSLVGDLAGGEVVGLLSIKDIAHALAQRVQLHEDLKREQSLPPVHDG